MNKDKTSLKLPLFLLVAPATSVALMIVAPFVLGPLIVAMTPAPTDPELFGEQPFMVTVLNILLFIIGAVGVVGMIAFVPCVIIGLIMLSRRTARRKSL